MESRSSIPVSLGRVGEDSADEGIEGSGGEGVGSIHSISVYQSVSCIYHSVYRSPDCSDILWYCSVVLGSIDVRFW